jgi:tRNA pseudouridine38-40 synthase
VNRYFLQLSYLGKNYNGWQVQKNIPQTVQGNVQTYLSTILQEKIEVVGCGRTDTGVHAKQYFAHFDSEKSDLVINKIHWLYKLNKISAFDIAFHDIISVNENVSARFDAIGRTYEYHILKVKNVFSADLAWLCSVPFDIVKMNEAAAYLLEVKDFTSFSKVNTQAHTNNCDVSIAEWRQENDTLIFTIKANRFLRNMVRATVGTLLNVGEGKTSIAEFKQIVESKNRSNAGMSVPAHGLYLTEIEYPKSIF